jgi:hypothetical protein
LQAPNASQELVPEQLLSLAEATTVVHVPAAFAQDRHGVVQPFSQQRPSTQVPFAHSDAAPHACPWAFLQVPVPSQKFAPSQVPGSVVLVTSVVHVPVAFAHERQGVVHASWQQVPSTQNPLAQGVASPHPTPRAPRQSPAAEQVKLPEQLSSLPTTTVVQVPAALAHDRQGVVQPSAQQRPSTQFPLAHSVAPLHVWPCAFLHTPDASQICVPVHVSSLALVTAVHVPRVAPAALQRWQVPHAETVQHTLSTQKPVSQSAEVAQSPPRVW